MTTFLLLTVQIAVLIIVPITLSVAERSFQIDTTWPHPSLPNIQLHATAIATDYENNLVVLNRGSQHANPDRNATISEAVVTVLDHDTGEILRQWGENFFHHPHGIETADNGDIFITDSHLHQVFKVIEQLTQIME